MSIPFKIVARDGVPFVVQMSGADLLAPLLNDLSASVAVAIEAANDTKESGHIPVAATKTSPSDDNSWTLTLPGWLTLTDGVRLQFDAPSTPDAVPTGSGDGIRIVIGGVDRGVYFTDGPAVGVDAKIQQNWRVYVRFYGPGNVFTYEGSSYDNRRVQLLEQRLQAPALEPVDPDDSRFFTSDYPSGSTITNDRTTRKVVRPVADVYNQRASNPGMRERCGINPVADSSVTWNLRFQGVNSNAGSIPSNIPVQVRRTIDGVSQIVATINPPTGRDKVGYRQISAPVLGGVNQLLELIYPYGWEIEVVGRLVPPGATMNLSEVGIERPETVLQMTGDSIVQGYSATATTDTFAFKLAEELEMRLQNNGYGGRFLLGSDGAVYGAVQADLTVNIAGINNMTPQFPPADIYTEAYNFVVGFVTAHPGGRLLMVTPFWNLHVDQNVVTYPGSVYRAQIEDAVADAIAFKGADAANVRVLDGLTLTVNNSSSVVGDGTHLTDASHASVAAGLEAFIIDEWPELLS